MDDEGIKQRLERLDSTMDAIRVESERNRVEFGRNRAFNREMLMRYDQLARDTERRWVQESRWNREVQSALIDRIEQMGKEMRAEIREQIAEIRAQTEAIFRVIDRLDSEGGPAPGTS